MESSSLRSSAHVQSVRDKRFTTASRRLLAGLIVLTVAGALAGAAAPHSTTLNRRTTGITINLAYAKGASSAAWFVADAKGYFAHYGITINYIFTSNPAPVLASGSADMALTSSTYAYSSAGTSQPTPIIADITKYTFGYLMVQKSADTPAYHQPFPKNLQALPKGTTIGLGAPGSVNALWLSALMTAAGLQVGTDYNVAYFSSTAAIYAALLAGQINVALLTPPISATATLSGQTATILNNFGSGVPASAKVFTGGWLIARKSWLDANLSVAKEVVAALTRGMLYIHDPNHAAEVAQIDANAVGSDATTIGSVLPDIVKISDPVVSCGPLGNEMDVYFKVNQIGARPSCNDVVDWRVAPTKDPFALTASVGPGSSFSLLRPSGTYVVPGAYAITVDDHSANGGFTLSGPGINKSTGKGFRGKVTWNVTFQPGHYTFGSTLSSKRKSLTVPQ